MAKAAVQFACVECGYSAGRWFGKCPSCGSFGTLQEEAPPPAPGAAVARPILRLVDVEAEESARIPTGVEELDRVLGGGLVPASLVLVGGEPGVGKSTLLGGAERVEILAETELEAVCATLERERPDVCVIDSVQTLYSSELDSAPGSVAQVREAAGRLLRVAKGERRRDLPRRPRDEGRHRRRPAGARATRR